MDNKPFVDYLKDLANNTKKISVPKWVRESLELQKKEEGKENE